MTDETGMIELRERVGRLERWMIAAYTIVVAAILIAGLCVPWVVQRAGREDEAPWSVLGYIVQPLETGDDVPFTIALLIGFLGLLAVILLIFVTVLLPAARGTMTDRGHLFRRTLLILGIVGAAVVVLLSLMALNVESNAFAPGGLVLLLGMLGVLPLLGPAARPLVFRGL